MRNETAFVKWVSLHWKIQMTPTQWSETLPESVLVLYNTDPEDTLTSPSCLSSYGNEKCVKRRLVLVLIFFFH